MKEKLVRDTETPTIQGKAVMLAYRGKRPIRRYIRVERTKLMPLARFLWDFHYPADKVGPGEEIHHKDFNPLHDTLDNLVKLTEYEHLMIHQQKIYNEKDNRALSARIAAEIRQAIEGRKIRRSTGPDEEMTWDERYLGLTA